MARIPQELGLTEARTRNWLANVVELLQVRLELLGVEARMEMQRMILVAVCAIVGALMLAFGLVFLAAFIAVALWQTHALLALGLITAFFVLGGIGLALLAKSKISGMADMFSGTREELRLDRQRLRGEEP